MNTDIRGVSTRSLARELVVRIPRKVRDRLQGRAAQEQSKGAQAERKSFAVLERDGLPSVELWAGYRNSIKARWPSSFWPLRVLFDLNRRVPLPRPLQQLDGDLKAARTLPVSLDEVVDLLEPQVERYPEHFRRGERAVDGILSPVFALVPTQDEVSFIYRSYLSSVSGLLDTLVEHGFKPETGRALEIGCGRGYSTLAMAALGVGESIGLDRERETYYSLVEEGLVRKAFLGRETDERERSVIQEGDATDLPFPDESIDIVHSASVLEHISDPRIAVRETHRVLKPGGMAYHSVDPWFSPAGGHSVCTLDFPWGHVRLSSVEFDGYLRTYRTHEREIGLDFYSNGFQSPRMTIGEMQALVIEEGFEIKLWRESPSHYEDHYVMLDEGLLSECRRQHPQVTVRDLMVDGYNMLLRKR